jgi:hypothetical protein
MQAVLWMNIALLFYQQRSFPLRHTVTLTWADPNPFGTTWNVYRTPGACPGAAEFFRIAGGLDIPTYVDVVLTGSYCYGVTAVTEGQESSFSNTVSVAIP